MNFGAQKLAGIVLAAAGVVVIALAISVISQASETAQYPMLANLVAELTGIELT